MALVSQTALRGDPVLNHNFVISLLDSSSTLGLLGSIAMPAIFDVAAGGFSECSGLEMSLQLEEFSEGGNNVTIAVDANFDERTRRLLEIIDPSRRGNSSSSWAAR